MKIKTNRLIASGLLSLVFILEMFVMHGLFDQIGPANLAVSYLFVVYGTFLVPVFAVLIGNPVFEKTGVKYAVVYSAVLYVCSSILLYSPANTLYGAGLSSVLGLASPSTTAGYYVLAAKAVLILAALVIAVAEPKEKVLEEATILSGVEAPKPEDVELPGNKQDGDL